MARSGYLKLSSREYNGPFMVKVRRWTKWLIGEGPLGKIWRFCTQNRPKTSCSICLECKYRAEFTLLACQANICLECTRRYVKEELDLGRTSIACPFHCMTPGCGLNGQVLENICWVDTSLFQHLWRVTLENGLRQLQNDVNLIRCPTPDCQNVLWTDKIKASSTRNSLLQRMITSRKYSVDERKRDRRRFQCDSCGYSSCMFCHLPWNVGATHEDLSCEVYARKMPRGEREMENLLRKAVRHIAKACPSCNELIEKNAGCQHMTCRCGHQFCWLCLSEWHTHSMTACSKSQCAIQ